jgi:hypothetical protein
MPRPVKKQTDIPKTVAKLPELGRRWAGKGKHAPKPRVGALRDHRIDVRVTARDHEAFGRVAYSVGMSVSDWLRTLGAAAVAAAVGDNDALALGLGHLVTPIRPARGR